METISHKSHGTMHNQERFLLTASIDHKIHSISDSYTVIGYCKTGSFYGSNIPIPGFADF